MAVHGNVPFDVPYLSEITDNLWVGGCADGLILPGFIQHVVSLYPWESYLLRHELMSQIAVRMYDSIDGPDRDVVVTLARWVNVCRKTGPTLVHCQAGLNRSNLVAGMALIMGGIAPGLDPKDAIALLRDKRSPAVLCNPSFVKILMNEYVDPEED